MTEWKIKLIDKIHRSANIYSFRFERPENLKYKSGQFSYFYIPKKGGGELFHHFSFSSSPTEPFVEFTTRIRESEYKQTLDKLPIGSTIKMSMVLGQFSLNPKFNKIAFVCGGIGITAARSNIKWATDTKADVNTILLFANRHSYHIAFKEELESLSNDKFKVFHIISQPDENWKGATGRINAEFIKNNVPDFIERKWFVSGPPEMVERIDNILTKEIHVPLEVIREEFFIGY
jgi:ferredoxin-NADP reductase